MNSWLMRAAAGGELGNQQAQMDALNQLKIQSAQMQNQGMQNQMQADSAYGSVVGDIYGSGQNPDKLAMSKLIATLREKRPDASPSVVGEVAGKFMLLMQPQEKSELAAAKNQAEIYKTMLQVQGRVQSTQQQVQGRENVAGMQDQSREKIAGMNVAGRENVAGMQVQGRENVAGMQDQSREKIAGIKGATGGGKITSFQIKDRQLYDHITEAMDLGDETVQSIQKTMNSVGLAGKAGRVGETLGNILGSSDDTSRSIIEGNITSLREQLSRLVVGNNRVTKADRDDAAKILRGLEMGSTPQNTIASIRAAQKMIFKANQGTIQRYSQSPSTPKENNPSQSSDPLGLFQ